VPTVETVRGPVDVDELGRTLMHEHVFIMQPEALQNWGHAFGPCYWDERSRIDDAVAKLTALRQGGITTIVDPTHPDGVRFYTRGMVVRPIDLLYRTHRNDRSPRRQRRSAASAESALGLAFSATAGRTSIFRASRPEQGRCGPRFDSRDEPAPRQDQDCPFPRKQHSHSPPQTHPLRATSDSLSTRHSQRLGSRSATAMQPPVTP